MNDLLQIDTSIYGAEGASTGLADAFVAAWRERHPDVRVTKRDLVADPVPHLTAARFLSFQTPPGERTPDQQAAVDYSDGLIRELERASVIVLGIPMYNFGIPSQLKAYFDHIARAGVTFRYGPNGAEGLLRGKRVVVFAARGGVYGADQDHLTPHVRQFLAFLGMDEVEIVYAEGLASGADRRAAALAEAHAALQNLIRGSVLAA